MSKRKGETHPSCKCFVELVPDPASPVWASGHLWWGLQGWVGWPPPNAHRSVLTLCTEAQNFISQLKKICWHYIFCFGNYSCKSTAFLLILLNSWLERCCVAGGPTSWLFATQTSLSLHQFSLLFGYPYSWLIKMMWFRASCFEGCWLAQPSSA